MLISAVAIFFAKRFFEKNNMEGSATAPSGSVQPLSTPSTSAPTQQTEKKKIPLKEFVHNESARVGEVDDHPELTELKLKDYAYALTKEECGELAAMVLDQKTQADQRLLAAYLLSEVQGEQAIPALSKIALSKIPATPNERANDEERSFRALAVEGLGKIISSKDAEKVLREVASPSAQPDAFLNDRAERALYGIQKGSSHEPEIQDKEALEKIMKGKKK